MATPPFWLATAIVRVTGPPSDGVRPSAIRTAAYSARREHPTLPRSADRGDGPHTVTTDRGTFAVLDNRSAVDEPTGQRVLVPGFTGSKEDFIAVLAPLAARGVHAVALDLAGQYESTRPDDTEHYSLAGFAADVWSVAHQLAGPRVLVGHSFGGLVVRDAVLSDPLSAEGLVIVASGPAALPDDQQRVLRMFAQVLRSARARRRLAGQAGAG